MEICTHCGVEFEVDGYNSEEISGVSWAVYSEICHENRYGYLVTHTGEVS